MSQLRVAKTPNEKPAQILYPIAQRTKPTNRPKIPSTPFDTIQFLHTAKTILIKSNTFFIVYIFTYKYNNPMLSFTLTPDYS